MYGVYDQDTLALPAVGLGENHKNDGKQRFCSPVQPVKYLLSLKSFRADNSVLEVVFPFQSLLLKGVTDDDVVNLACTITHSDDNVFVGPRLVGYIHGPILLDRQLLRPSAAFYFRAIDQYVEQSAFPEYSRRV
jgi:hypothetical protein